MSPQADTSDFLTPLLGLAAVIVIISRLVRIARHNASAEGNAPPGTPRPPLWGPVRRLEKLQQSTAIVRGETQLLVSTGENLQARHTLDRLTTELRPPAPPVPPARAPSLTIAEIAAVLAAVPLAPELRATLLELFEATANEKVRR